LGREDVSDIELRFGSNDGDIDPVELARYKAALDRLWAEDAHDVRGETDAFRQRLKLTHDDAFTGLFRVYISAIEAADWGSEAMDKVIGRMEADNEDRADIDALADYHWVIRGFMAPAPPPFGEITSRLEGGFPGGATARARTLQELAVTAAVLAIHGHPDGEHPELIERYARHHEVFNRDSAVQISASGILEDDPFDESTMGLLSTAHDELLAEFGRKFAEPYGWAQPIFKARERVSFTKLSKLVTPRLEVIYRLSSSHVHADSEGWSHGLVTRGDEQMFAAGPTNLGLGLPAELACDLLNVMLQLAVPSSIADEGQVDSDGTLLLAGVRHLTQQALTALHNRQSEVEAAEQDFQAGESA